MRINFQPVRSAVPAIVSLWILGVPLWRLWRIDRDFGYASGVVIVGAFILVGLLQYLTGRRFKKYSWLILAVPIAFLALRPGGAPTPRPAAWRLEWLDPIWRVAQVSDGGKIAAAVTVAALTLAALSAIVFAWRREWKIPAGLLLTPVGCAALAILWLGENVANVIPAFLTLFVALVFGRFLLRAVLGKEPLEGPLEWVISVCLGSGAISLLGLALGSMRMFNRAAIGLTTGVIAILSWRGIWELARRAPTGLRGLSAPVDLRRDLAFTGAGGLLAIAALAGMMAALAPDLGFDSTTFHLAMANTFARQGSLAPSPMSHYYYEQIPIQTLYAGINVFSNLTAAKFLHFMYGVLAVLGAAALTMRLTGRAKAALLASAIIGCSSLIWWLCGVGYVDLAVMFFFLATICALVRWVETGRTEWVLVTGLCAGIAISTKLTNLALVLIVGLAVLACQIRSARRILISSALFAAGVCLTWLPWLSRSYRLTGNPIFPYGNDLFRSPLVEPVAVFASVPFGFGTGIGALLNLPLTVTFSPERFVEVGELGPQLLAFSPLLPLLFWRRSSETKLRLALLGALTVFFFAWAFGLNQNLRYLTPALPLLAVLFGVGYHQLTSGQSTFGWRGEAFLAPVVVAALFLSALTNAISSQSWWLGADGGSGLPYKLALGSETREGYVKTHVNATDAIRWLNQRYGDKAQIWSIGSGKRAYSESPIYFYHDVHTTLPMRSALDALNGILEPQEISARLKGLGFTHVLLNGEIPEMSLPESQRPMYLRPEFLDRYTNLEYADNGVVLYKLFVDPQSPPQVSVEKLQNGGFETGAGAGAAQWGFAPSARIDRSGKESLTGAAAVAVDGTSSYFSAPVQVEGGRTYRLRVSARAPQPRTTGRLHLQFLSEQKRPLPGAWLPFYPDAQYRAHEIFATAPSGARYARVILMGASPQRWVWYDDVSLAELDLPNVFRGSR